MRTAASILPGGRFLAAVVLTSALPWIAACYADSLVDPAANDTTAVTRPVARVPTTRIDSTRTSPSLR